MSDLYPDESTTDEFWDLLCGAENLVVQVLAIQLLFLLLSLVSLVFVSRDSSAFVVILLTITIVVLTGSVAGYVLYKCSARRQRVGQDT